MLESLDAWALITIATRSEELFKSGEIDSTSDVPQMARTDNVWSLAAIFTVGMGPVLHLSTVWPS